MFRDCTLTGTFNNGSFITVVNSYVHDIHNVTIDLHDCFVNNMDEVEGEMNICTLSGLISIIPSGRLSGIELVFDTDETIIDLQYANTTVSLDINSGIVTFKNANTGCLIELNMRGGEVVLDPTCNGGEFYVEGYGTLYDNGTMVIKDNHLLAKETITYAILDEPTADHDITGSVSKALIDAGSAGNPWSADLSSNNDVGTFGEFIQTLLTAESKGELSAVPNVDATLAQQIQFLYQYFRNKKTVSGTQEKMYMEDGSLVGTATLGDDGTTFTKDTMV